MRAPVAFLPTFFVAFLSEPTFGHAKLINKRISTSPSINAVQSNATGLSAGMAQLIRGILNTTATESWEIGTHMEALLEYDYSSLSVFSPSSTPPSFSIAAAQIATPVLTTASQVVANKSADSLQLVEDGSSSDPASIGISVVLANWTAGIQGARYAMAASEQVESLLQDAPRAADGAISHRMEQVALWADFVYMAPPFLAYYGAMTGNFSLLQIAYEQCSLYRDNLRTSSGLWNHITFGSSPDKKAWATGNGWAAAGMLRVAATMMHSTFASTFTSQIADLGEWTQEIVNASFALQQPDGLFPNYFNVSHSFTDASSAALLASVSYRLAFLNISTTTLPAAEITRQAIYSSLSSKGILSPVVNPLSFAYQGTESPEGEAFVLLMEAAWRDWYEAQSNGNIVQEAPAAAAASASSGAIVSVISSRGRSSKILEWWLGITILLMVGQWGGF